MPVQMMGRIEIPDLIAQLDSREVNERQHARQALIEAGPLAVDPLLNALNNPNEQMRWEIIKTLKGLHSPKAIPVLIRSLEDPRMQIRWLAAEALIALGRAGLPPLLRALIEHPESPWLREGAHRILNSYARAGMGPEVEPVLDALEQMEPDISVPLAAHAVLASIGSD